ncbi:MAG TPA: hypothetical protein VFV87_02715 [Pirellulaceae bacterium]|nr:hypothetical protein [Pirellulaceae bacterium]
MSAMWNKVLVAALALSAIGFIAGSGSISIGQEAKAQKTEKKAKGRLPAYFADIVTDDQRTAIYKIQASYKKQIDDLESQLTALRDKEAAEIEGVLDAEQKEKLKAAREAAAAKKKKKATSEKTTEAGTTTPPAAKTAKTAAKTQ